MHVSFHEIRGEPLLIANETKVRRLTLNRERSAPSQLLVVLSIFGLKGHNSSVRVG
jgi:hypothetical protein